MNKNLTKILEWASTCSKWRKTRRAIKHPFRVSFSKAETGHWHGGPPLHRKARCIECQKPLRLVWNIDLGDRRLPDSLRVAFPKLTGLPLYYCFNCPEATTYQVTSDKTISCMDSNGHDGGDETPYAHETVVPQELPRRPIRLTPIPSVVDGLMTLENELEFRELDAAGQQMLSKFLGENISSSWDLVFSQFGGQPAMIQGHWDINCPNNKCWSKKQKVEDAAFHLKELAVVESDGLDGFEWAYAPLAYHLCWLCGTIQGNFRCS